MSLHNLVSHPEVQLPATWDSCNDFKDYLRSRFDTYMRLVDQIGHGKVTDLVMSRKPVLVGLCTQLCQAIQFSFEGRLYEAYKVFDAAMETISPELETLSFKVDGPNSLLALYRVRQTQIPFLKPVDLFHIPFDLRHLVGTQRYSIPGLPCLYLAGSLYTCWEEMGRPPFHELQCAALWVKPDMKLKMLNFSNRPARLLLEVPHPGMDAADPKRFAAHIVLWPLMFACSIKVKHRNSPFKPEYVIPQMALQWVTHNREFDGLVYFSTHVRTLLTKNPLPTCNIVLPAKKIAAEGRCEHLCSVFKMTEPIGWQLLSSINVGGTVNFSTIPSFEVEFIDGIKEPYEKSAFGIVQRKLNALVGRTIDLNKTDPAKGDIPVI